VINDGRLIRAQDICRRVAEGDFDPKLIRAVALPDTNLILAGSQAFGIGRPDRAWTRRDILINAAVVGAPGECRKSLLDPQPFIDLHRKSTHVVAPIVISV